MLTPAHLIVPNRTAPTPCLLTPIPTVALVPLAQHLNVTVPGLPWLFSFNSSGPAPRPAVTPAPLLLPTCLRLPPPHAVYCCHTRAKARCSGLRSFVILFPITQTLPRMDCTVAVRLLLIDARTYAPPLVAPALHLHCISYDPSFVVGHFCLAVVPTLPPQHRALPLLPPTFSYRDTHTTG